MPKGQIPHPSDEQILLYFDGELPGVESERVRLHTERCWGCRARLDDISRTVSTVVRARAIRLQSFAQEPPPSWPGLEGRIEQLERGFARRSFVSRIAAALPRLRSVRPVAIAAAVLLAVALLYLLNSPRVLSAKEILQRSRISENNDLHSQPRAAIHQRVRLRRTEATPFHDASVDYELWYSSSGVSRASEPLAPLADVAGRQRDAVGSELRSEFRRICEQNALDWQTPLSAEAYERWHGRAKVVGDSVTEGETITLATKADRVAVADQIQEAEFVVRRPDWHPIELRLTVAGRVYDIAELSYQVIDEATLAPAILAAGSIPPAPITKPLQEAHTPKPPLPEPFTNVAETELSVLWELHRAGADLGEPIEVFCCADAGVVVQALGISDSRRSLLEQVAAKFPNVKLDFSGAVSRLRPANIAPRNPQSARQSPAASTGNLQETIAKYFGSPGDEERFARQVLNQTDALLNRAYALRLLAERWTSAEEAALPRESLGRLHQIVLDHFAGARGAAAQIGVLLPPVLISLGAAESSEPSEKASAWQTKSLSLFGSAQRIDQLSRRIFTVSDHPENSPAALQDLLDSTAVLGRTLASAPENMTAFQERRQ